MVRLFFDENKVSFKNLDAQYQAQTQVPTPSPEDTATDIPIPGPKDQPIPTQPGWQPQP